MAFKKLYFINILLKSLLSAALIVMGGCLIAGCITIYYSGEQQPYTREIVAATLKNMAFIFYICIGLTVTAFITDHLCKNNKKRIVQSTAQTLKIITKNRELSPEFEHYSTILKERGIRRKYTIIFAVINVISALCFFTFTLDFSNFDRTDINGSVIAAMPLLALCFTIYFATSFLLYWLKSKSQKREIELLKSAPKKTAAHIENISLGREKKLQILKFSLLAVFLAFAIIGFILGGTADVLTKAVNICTECIGLG